MNITGCKIIYFLNNEPETYLIERTGKNEHTKQRIERKKEKEKELGIILL